MKTSMFACATFACAILACPTYADPLLSVTPLGTNVDGNRDWLVEIKPDETLFWDPPSDDPDKGPGGSMAVELAFAIDFTELLDVEVNTSAWDFANPGHNPFTGTITDGLWLDLIGDRTFGAFGSIFFNSPDRVELFKIETLGDGLSRIRWGEAASGHETHGATLAQAGRNFQTPPGETTVFTFTGITGAVAVPEPTSPALAVLGLMIAPFITRRRRASKMLVTN